MFGALEAFDAVAFEEAAEFCVEVPRAVFNAGALDEGAAFCGDVLRVVLDEDGAVCVRPSP